MFTFVFTVLDVLVIVGIFLAITRFIRVIFKRAKCIATLKKICKKQGYTLKFHHSPLLSIFYKWHKIDFSVHADQKIYRVKLLTFFSPRKVCHFIDDHSYVCYLKSFFALPMPTKISEHPNILSYHRLPTFSDSQSESETFVLLCNPTPNEITYIETDGSRQVADNHCTIGSFLLYNAKGFCSLLGGYLDK
ncbi:MAG: hypothetical protein E7584_00650 [Ruminococcaceae bacterium]|nr:hypothetical protein [Oscillospiraceae bacterium]